MKQVELPLVVFRMDHNFTEGEVRDELRRLKGGKKNTSTTVDETEVRLYLDRLVRFGILTRRGPNFFF